jgi:membrane protease YdiL (CAAX protease family)
MTSENHSETIQNDLARLTAMFPFLKGGIAVALIRLLTWLLLLGLIEHTPAPARLALSIVWIVTFLSRYANRTPLVSSDTRFVPLLRRPLFAGYVFVLVVLMALAAPWIQFLLRGPNTGVLDSSAMAGDPIQPGSSSAVLLIAFAVISITSATYPLLEEFFSRGWLFVSLRERYSLNATVLITSAVFMLLHLSASPGYVIMRFVFGLALAYAVVLTGSIWTSVAMHYAWNLSIFYFASPATDGIRTAQFLGIDPTYRRAWIATIVSSLLCGTILLLLRQSARSRAYRT